VLAGYDDWRLPSVNELVTIVDETRSHPATDPVFIYRSADNNFGTSNGAVVLLTGEGELSGSPTGAFAKCVR
jgi:hypothetical protein